MEEEEKSNPELPVFTDPLKTPKAAFERFKWAIFKNDINKALSLMTDSAKDKYERFFEQLGEHRRDYAEGLGPIYFDTKVGNMLFYEMSTEQDEGMVSFPVHFVEDDRGNWLICEL